MPLPPYEPSPLRGVTPTWAFVLVVCAGLVLVMRSTEGELAQPRPDARQSLHVIGRNVQETMVERLQGADWSDQEANSTRLEYRRGGPEGALEAIEVNADADVVLIEDPGGEHERRRRLGGPVAKLLQGELPNGLDDNMNGLVDECGLAFTHTDGVLEVALTLETVQRQAPYVRMTLISKFASSSTP